MGRARRQPSRLQSSSSPFRWPRPSRCPRSDPTSGCCAGRDLEPPAPVCFTMPALVTDTEDRRPDGLPRPTAPRSSADVAELRRAVAQIRWFHRIDLGDGVVTPGEDDTREKLKTLHLPQDLRVTTVLDIG